MRDSRQSPRKAERNVSLVRRGSTHVTYHRLRRATAGRVHCCNGYTDDEVDYFGSGVVCSYHNRYPQATCEAEGGRRCLRMSGIVIGTKNCAVQSLMVSLRSGDDET